MQWNEDYPYISVTILKDGKDLFVPLFTVGGGQNVHFVMGESNPILGTECSNPLSLSILMLGKKCLLYRLNRRNHLA